jgi:hypothetical protein
MATTSDPSKYAAISQRLIAQAEAELQSGDRLQASEKAWGAVAHAVKAVAHQRAWDHNSHDLLYDAARQLADENRWSRWQRRLFREAGFLHTNFYEDWLEDDEVQDGIEQAKVLLGILESVRREPARPFTPRTAAQQERLNRLTGRPAAA